MKYQMKWTSRLTALLLCLILALGTLVLSACNDGTGDPDTDTPSGETPGGMPGGQNNPIAPGLAGEGEGVALVNADGTPRYVRVIRSEFAKSVEKDAAVLARKTLNSVLGVSMGILEDYATDAEWPEINEMYEILIGNTNRPESRAAMEELGEDQFVIRMTDKKLVITGVDENHTMMAVKYFLEHYVGCDPKTWEAEGVENIWMYADTNDIRYQEYIREGLEDITLVSTEYSTEDVVVADVMITPDNYDVDPTGEKDSTAGIQQALFDVEKQGGGTAFLPVGDYRITKILRIPAFCVLRGDWQDPDLGNEYGTVLLLDIAESDEMTMGTILLGASGGAYGLTVYYPNQSLDDVKTYPFTFYFNREHQSKGSHMPTVKNCTIINGYRGVGASVESESGHEMLTIENLKGTFLSMGVGIGYSSDVGTCTNISIGPKYWAEFAEARGIEGVSEDKVAAYTRAHTTGMRMSDVEWTEYIHLTITDCLYGINIIDAKRIEFAGSFYDTVITDCDVAIKADELDERWGMHVSNSYLEGSVSAIENNSHGLIKTAGTTIVGGLMGDGYTLVDDVSLVEYEIDTGKTYKKPNAVLYIAHDLDITGKTDVSEGLQKWLDEAAKTGGLVYLPGGDYRLEKPVTVPTGVELRGTACTGTREQDGYGIGTRIMAYYGLGGDADDTAMITLQEGSGIVGIRIAYPTVKGDAPETAYAIRGTGKDVYAVNMCMIGAGRGIDFSGCDNHFIKKLTSFCLINDVKLGGKNGTVTGFLHNGTVRARIGFSADKLGAGTGAETNDTNYYGRRLCTTFIIENAEGQRIWNAFSYGVYYMVHAIDCKDLLIVNLGSDNLYEDGAQMYFEGGEATVIGVLRYNAVSYKVEDGAKVKLYSRLAINEKREDSELIGY